MKSLHVLVVLLGTCLFSRRSTEAFAQATEPKFSELPAGVLPLNLQSIRVKRVAVSDDRIELASTPPMCIARLSALVDSAGGTDLLMLYESTKSSVNVAFRSGFGDDEVTLHCASANGIPVEHAYNVSVDMGHSDGKDGAKLLKRIGTALWKWKPRELDKAYAACLRKIRERLQKDMFGVVPDYGSVKGMECFGGDRLRIALFAPDVE